ncbi:uncharacterized protein LOC111136876 isoform X2 [Crassostrea virginica]
MEIPMKLGFGALAVFSLFILIFQLVLFRLVWRRLKTLEKIIKTLLLTVTNDENFIKEHDGYEGYEAQNNHADVTTTVYNPSSQNQVNVSDDVRTPGGSRKMCKSDSELTMRNKLFLLSKLQADIKEKVVYEKCRLPFDVQ